MTKLKIPQNHPPVERYLLRKEQSPAASVGFRQMQQNIILHAF